MTLEKRVNHVVESLEEARKEEKEMTLNERTKKIAEGEQRNNPDLNQPYIPRDLAERIFKAVKKENIDQFEASDIIINMIDGDEEDHDVLRTVACMLAEYNTDIAIHIANLIMYEKARLTYLKSNEDEEEDN